MSMEADFGVLRMYPMTPSLVFKSFRASCSFLLFSLVLFFEAFSSSFFSVGSSSEDMEFHFTVLSVLL